LSHDWLDIGFRLIIDSLDTDYSYLQITTWFTFYFGFLVSFHYAIYFYYMRLGN
jgi:hypothetical protein